MRTITIKTALTCLFIACFAPVASQANQAYTPSQGIFTLTVDEAERALGLALAEEGVAEMVKAQITNTRPGILYRHSQAMDVAVKSLKYDASESSFSANLFFVSGGDVLSAMPVSGRFDEMIAIPVLKHRVYNGDIIEQDDLEDIAYPISRLRKDTIVQPRSLIGKTPRRVISGNRPVRERELSSPDILEKGATVNMRYDTPYMIISTVGEALEAGAEGEHIRVRNLDSGTIVEARVNSEREVLVGRSAIRTE